LSDNLQQGLNAFGDTLQWIGNRDLGFELSMLQFVGLQSLNLRLPNLPEDGVSLLETDWTVTTFTMNWKELESIIPSNSTKEYPFT
jgi:hypothetical protein